MAQELFVELENRFLASEKPSDLTLAFSAAPGGGTEQEFNHLAHEGLVKKVFGAHFGVAPKLYQMVLDNKIIAYNLPMGVMASLFREMGAKRPGIISNVGIGTFIDPRLEGGKMNEKTKPEKDYIKLINVKDKDYLFFEAIPVDYAFIWATYADEKGNISIEKEVSRLDSLAIAQACKANGGKVIVQVHDVVKSGDLDPMKVELASTLVDYVVVASDDKYRKQTVATQYNPGLSGEHRMPAGSVAPQPLTAKKIIGRRGAMELRNGSIVNLGVGIPEYVSLVAIEEGIINGCTMTVEDGIFGGGPQSGLDFGSSLNPESMIPMPDMLNFYDGGGLNQCFLGFAELDGSGNVNVSKFGPVLPGCGGFIDISQNTKEVYFCGTFTAAGLKIEAKDGELHILQEGKVDKICKAVEQISFSAKTAISNGDTVLYITERAVFKLTDKGIELIEIAPGVDLEKDVLAHMPIRPIISKNLKKMDARIFTDEKMGLKQ